MFCSICGTQGAPADRFCPKCGSAMATAMTPPAPAPAAAPAVPASTGARTYAGFWLRFVASVIDWIAVAIINGLVSIFLTPVVGFFTALLSGWLYHALLESSERQATLGKMAMSIYVTDLGGQRISLGTATVRHFCKILSALLLMIGFIMAGFTAKKQALHDLLANTLVVRR